MGNVVETTRQWCRQPAKGDNLLTDIMRMRDAKGINTYLVLGSLYLERKEFDDTGQPGPKKLEDYFI